MSSAERILARRAKFEAEKAQLQAEHEELMKLAHEVTGIAMLPPPPAPPTPSAATQPPPEPAGTPVGTPTRPRRRAPVTDRAASALRPPPEPSEEPIVPVDVPSPMPSLPPPPAVVFDNSETTFHAHSLELGSLSHFSANNDDDDDDDDWSTDSSTSSGNVRGIDPRQRDAMRQRAGTLQRFTSSQVPMLTSDERKRASSSRELVSPRGESSGSPIILTIHIPHIQTTKKLRFGTADSIGRARLQIDDSLRVANLLSSSEHMALFNDKDDARTRLDENAPLSAYHLLPMSSLYYMVEADVPIPESEDERRERHRVAVVNELIATETDYVADLTVIVKLLMKPCHERALLTSKQMSDVFRNLPAILALHREFLADLRAKSAHVGICPVFEEHMRTWDAYGTYCATVDSAAQLLKRLRAELPDFNQLATDLERSPHCLSKGDIAAFMFKPVQRVCKYPLLLREYERKCAAGSREQAEAQAAQAAAASLTKRVNRRRNEAECAARFAALLPRLVDAPTDLQTPTRALVRDQELTVFLKGKPRATRLVILFNDLLLICNARKKEYQVIEVFDLDGGCYVTEYEEKAELATWAIVRFDSEQSKAIIKCETAAERSQWLVDVRQQQGALPHGSSAATVASNVDLAPAAPGSPSPHAMTARERERLKLDVLTRALAGERAYAASFSLLARLVKACRKHAAGLASESREARAQQKAASIVLCNAAAVVRAHRSLLQAFELALSKKATHRINALFPERLYSAVFCIYVDNYHLAETRLQKELKRGSQFAQLVERTLGGADAQPLAVLLAPINRMREHLELIKTATRLSDSGSKEQTSLRSSFATLGRAMKDFDRRYRAADDLSKLRDVLALIKSEREQEVPLLRRGRSVKLDACVKLIIEGDAKRPLLRRIWLCNDIIIVCAGKEKDASRPHSDGKWLFKKMLKLKNMLIRDFHDTPNAFELVTLGGEKRLSVVVICDTLSAQKKLKEEISAKIKAIIKHNLKKAERRN